MYEDDAKAYMGMKSVSIAPSMFKWAYHRNTSPLKQDKDAVEHSFSFQTSV